MSIIFDLNNDLSFDNFQTLSANINKNSPSASVLRGKGSLHSAENFVFSDKVTINFILKKEELETMYNVYAMYRSKGMVFINSEEIYNKFFPHLEQKRIESLRPSFRSDIVTIRNGNDSVNDKEEKLKKLAYFLIKYKVVDTFEELKLFFSIEDYISESFYQEAISVNSEFNFTFNRPFLTMLDKFSISSLVGTSDGYSVDLSLSILDTIIDEESETKYRITNDSYSEYYRTIENKISSLFDFNDITLNIYSVENEISSFKTLNDKDQTKGAIEKIKVPETLSFAASEISQFEIITYNNIAEIPIQGKSTPLKQYLGVGESNFTLRMFYKNDETLSQESVVMQKLKKLQYLSSLEQRHLKIDCEFGPLNAMDLNGVQISDIHFANDNESDGFMVSIIMKVSGYQNTLRGNEVNIHGEAINETPYYKTKNNLPTEKIYIERALHLSKMFDGLTPEDYDQIIHSKEGSTEFTYKDLLYCYSSRNTSRYSEVKSGRADLTGIRSVMSSIEHSIEVILQRTFNFGDQAGYSASIETLKEVISEQFLDTDGSFYDYCLNTVNSMFPSDLANDNIYMINECFKVLLQTFLASMDEVIFLLLDRNTMLDILRRAYPSKTYMESFARNCVETNIKETFNILRDILNSEKFESDFRNIVTFNNLALSQDTENLGQPLLKDDDYSIRKVITEVKTIFDDMTIFEDGDIQSESFDLLVNQMMLIMKLRKQEFEANVIDFDVESEKWIEEDARQTLAMTDVITLGIMSIFSFDYGISSSSFGSTALAFYSKFIDAGIQANSLFNSLPKTATYESSIPGVTITNRDQIRDNVQEKILDKLYGTGFSNESDLFYRPLTSNVALNDLGSFLGTEASEFHSQNKILYKELINSLDFKNVQTVDYNTVIDPYGELISMYESYSQDYTNKSIEGISEEISNLIFDPESETTEEFTKENITDLINNSLRDSNSIFKEYEEGSLNFNQSVTSEDFKSARFDSFSKGNNSIKAFENLYSSDLLSCIPTYDVFITRESAILDLNTFAETLKIEDFLGIDKLTGMNVQYTEQVRGKTATFTFIDTSEDIKDYGTIPASYQIREYDDPSRGNDIKNIITSKVKNILRVGDGVHIRMGFNNENKVVFNGNVMSISEGKIKRVVCVSHIADLENDSFNITLQDGKSPLFQIGELFKFKNSYVRNKIKTSYEARKGTYVNNHIIFDGITTEAAENTVSRTIRDFSVAFNEDEAVSSFNMINSALAIAQKSLYHFTTNQKTTTNLALGLRNKQNFVLAGIRAIGELARTNNEEGTSTGINPGLIANLNNVDRDFVHYGIRPVNQIPSLNTTGRDITSQGEQLVDKKYSSNTIRVNNQYMILKGSSFVDAEIKLDHNDYKYSQYSRRNATFKDVLLDAERRAPGAYFDVIDNGFNSTLFYGRSNYNLDLHDQIETQSNYSNFKAERFLAQIQAKELDNFSNFVENGNINLYNLFIGLTSAISVINPDTYLLKTDSYEPNKVIQTNSNTFSEKYKMEKASNIVYAVTGKNLISNNIILNNQSANKITIDFDPSIPQKVVNFAKLDWRSKTSIYTSDILSSSGLNHKIREKIFDEPNIKNFYQATEVAQSLLQTELEGVYGGKITIVFNPDIRYRTEIKIYDTVNQVYGSVLVKDFEHKFDFRGSYTIITPMMKVEQNLILNDLSRKTFAQRLFTSESSEFAKHLKATSIFFNADEKTKPTLDFNVINDIIGKDISNVPIIVGNTVIHNDDQKNEDIKVLKLTDFQLTANRPLSLSPITSRNNYLIPDEDIYLRETREVIDTLFSTISMYANSVSSFFTRTSRQQSSLQENLGQYVMRQGFDKFSRLLNADLAVINSISTKSLLGETSTKTGSVYGDLKDLIIDYQITNKYTVGETTRKYLNKGSVAFWNVKVLKAHETDRIKLIADVISNFDVCGITELCGVALSGTQVSGNNTSDRPSNSDAFGNVTNICRQILIHLNEQERTNGTDEYEWDYQGPNFLRNNGQVVNFSFSSKPYYGDEYGTIFYRQHKKQNRRIFNIIDTPLRTINFPVEWDFIRESNSGFIDQIMSDGNRLSDIFVDETSITLGVQGILLEEGPLFSSSGLVSTDERTQIYFFHNIYNKKSDRTIFGSDIARSNGVKEILNLANNQNCMLLGDFNMTLYNGYIFKETPLLGQTAALYDASKRGFAFDEANLLRFKTKLKPLISPNNRTTLGKYADVNAYDQVLSTNTNRAFGVFRDIINQNLDTTRTTVSDHYPVFTRHKDR